LYYLPKGWENSLNNAENPPPGRVSLENNIRVVEKIIIPVPLFKRSQVPQFFPPFPESACK
jgi:hypothetical protein